jgi:hypothetical protein
MNLTPHRWSPPFYGSQHLQGLLPGFEVSVLALRDGRGSAACVVTRPGSPSEETRLESIQRARFFAERRAREIGALPTTNVIPFPSYGRLYLQVSEAQNPYAGIVDLYYECESQDEAYLVLGSYIKRWPRDRYGTTLSIQPRGDLFVVSGHRLANALECA